MWSTPYLNDVQGYIYVKFIHKLGLFITFCSIVCAHEKTSHHQNKMASKGIVAVLIVNDVFVCEYLQTVHKWNTHLIIVCNTSTDQFKSASSKYVMYTECAMTL